ncbi:MAG: hypothetical protein WBP11_12775 [Dokdonella sp.]
MRIPCTILLCSLIVIGISACSDRQSPASPIEGDQATATAPATVATSNAVLRMAIDGKPWQADQAIDAIIDPPTMNRTILINGSLGPKDANEQVFSLILMGLDGPGPIHLQSESPERGVVQISNLAPDRYLAGSILGYDMQVEVTQYSKDPVLVEARFSGSLTANDGTKLTLGDGYFRYSQ